MRASRLGNEVSEGSRFAREIGLEDVKDVFRFVKYD